MATAHKTIVPATQKLTADLEEAARLKALISTAETDLKAVAARIVKASAKGDQYQVPGLGKITVTARTERIVDVDVLTEVDADLADAVIERKVSFKKWDAMATLGKVSDDAKALVAEVEGNLYLTYSLATVR
jgi:hypothetical protein